MLQNQRFACHCVARRPRLIFLRVALRLTFVRARSQRRAAAPRATWAASGTAGVRREAGLGRRRDAWPVLRPSRTFKRRQPAARPRILHTRRHDRDERARCRALVRASCEGRLWPQQVHQMDLKSLPSACCRGGARHALRGAEKSSGCGASTAAKWWSMTILSRAVLWWGCA